ncbi:MAG: hypothetical protein WBQ95_03145 [Terracidiphilus sp.]
MKTLLSVKSFVEVVAGLALLLVPSTVVFLALGVPLERPGGLILARLGGVILLALGVACWQARNHSESRRAMKLIVALLVYDVSVVVLLLVARLAAQMSGIILWPAVVLHSALGVWSLLCLRRAP